MSRLDDATEWGQSEGQTCIVRTVREIYQYRNILWALVRRNLEGRYKSSYLGFTWHFITPFILIVIYHVVFTGIRGNQIDSFWVYLGSGLFPFTFMNANLISGSNCLVANSDYIKKMYFPREIVPLAQVTSMFIIMLFGYLVVLVLTFVLGYDLDLVALLVLPAIFILNFIFVLGMVLSMSTVVVYVRDIQHLLSSMAMIFFFTTPIFYLSSETTGMLSTLIWINPFTYFVEAYHSIVYYGSIPAIGLLAACVLLSVIILLVGIVTFRHYKKGFVERL